MVWRAGYAVESCAPQRAAVETDPACRHHGAVLAHAYDGAVAAVADVEVARLLHRGVAGPVRILGFDADRGQVDRMVQRRRPDDAAGGRHEDLAPGRPSDSQVDHLDPVVQRLAHVQDHGRLVVQDRAQPRRQSAAGPVIALVVLTSISAAGAAEQRLYRARRGETVEGPGGVLLDDAAVGHDDAEDGAGAAVG